MYGENGADRLTGGGDHDNITGGAGNDVLTGGDGRDRFIFVAGDGKDTITDFNFSQDKIQIDGNVVTDLASQLVAVSDGDYLLTYGNDEILFLADGDLF